MHNGIYQPNHGEHATDNRASVGDEVIERLVTLGDNYGHGREVISDHNGRDIIGLLVLVTVRRVLVQVNVSPAGLLVSASHQLKIMDVCTHKKITTRVVQHIQQK